MTRSEAAFAIARTVRIARDRYHGRRVVVVERDPGLWRIAYQVPHYLYPWRPGTQPDGWITLDWLDGGSVKGAREVLGFASRQDALREAAALRAEILERCPGARLDLLGG